MDKVTGFVIGTKTESLLNKEKHILEIELDKQDMQLLNWQNKKVLIKKLK